MRYFEEKGGFGFHFLFAFLRIGVSLNLKLFLNPQKIRSICHTQINLYKMILYIFWLYLQIPYLIILVKTP